MSMYRQLWLAIIVSMLLALAGSMLATLLSARAYLEQQLEMKNADNASALALSLSQQNPDIVTIELAVAALFDSGHYESIRIHDPHGKLIIERVAKRGELGAPEWLVRWLPIRTEPGEAQITSGWTQLGTVTLVSHTRFGYEALWTSIREMIAALTLASLIGGYLGSLILRRLRRPLQAVIDQAVAITNRRFVTIPEPDVPELHQLAEAMNSTVERLKLMFDEEAARLEAVRREANFDSLTGLANRDYLIAELRSALDNEHSRGGTLLLIRVADLVGVNRRLGRDATDDLLCRVASTIGSSAAAFPEALPARMNGADFALLLPGQRPGRKFAEEVLDALVKVMEPFTDGGTSAYIGVGGFDRGTALRIVLAQVDSALIAAEAGAANSVQEAAIDGGDDLPESNQEWARLIRQALDRRQLRLVSFPVVDMRNRLLHEECPLRLRLSDSDEWLPAGRFLPVAEKIGMVPALDLMAMTLGLDELEARRGLPGLAINLSASTVAEPGSIRAVEALLKKHRLAASRLWVEVAENGVFKHLDQFRSLCQILHQYHCHVGVEHFGRQFSQIGQFHDLGLDYVKFDASFIRRLESSPGNQAFLKGASTIAHGIGLQVIAEGVVTTEEFSALVVAGFDGATGPGVKTATLD
ncbi:MAG: EAL domain-containing protein [Sulfuritalea sp.]|jgi:EAL domain-containing protein (putative c-di-GMP-specific phosphodiesterase class I)/GGDEF domain-containing protein|nr:EAL domain-containing protein [Sulfuritalea sp.]